MRQAKPWIVAALAGIGILVQGCPAEPNGNETPRPGAVVINELLAHSHNEAADWVELFNTTDAAIDIGGWFLSDDEDDLMKYEIASGVAIPAGGYTMFYEDLHFGNAAAPGARSPFALSESGETVFLVQKGNGDTATCAERANFGASETGVAFGRHRLSTGAQVFVAMHENTPGAANSSPLVGPIVISEIMYNPASGDQDEEYLELHNIGELAVHLGDAEGRPWEFREGVDFAFPVELVVPPGGRVLVVKSPEAFAALYPDIPGEVQVVGPYDGKLNNGGEDVELAMPMDIDGQGDYAYVRMDYVRYDDEFPWPDGAGGAGLSLTRVEPGAFGDDVDNWVASWETPGQ